MLIKINSNIYYGSGVEFSLAPLESYNEGLYNIYLNTVQILFYYIISERYGLCSLCYLAIIPILVYLKNV